MGQHCWLLLATILTEDLAIFKWSKGQFPEPMPRRVVYAWTVGGTLLVLYPILNVRLHFGLRGRTVAHYSCIVRRSCRPQVLTKEHTKE